MKKILGLLLVGVLLVAVAPINATANTGGDDIVYDNSYDSSTYVADLVEPLAYNYVATDVPNVSGVVAVILINKEKVDINSEYLEDDDDVGWNYTDITYTKNIETENYDLPMVIPLR